MRRAVLSLLVLAGCATPSTSPRPNLVLILADDMGFSDLGCYGSEISTPRLDGLAARGTRFTQFYTAARCCPTRASLMTGVYPHQAGVGHMVEDRGLPAYRGFLNERPTIAEVLRGAGYRTLMAGKWHLGDAPGRLPVDRGFDRCFGLLGGGSNYFELEKGRKMVRDREPWSPTGPFYMTDLFTDAAVEFVKESSSPFFLYLAYTAPHWPLQAPPEDVEKYRGVYAAGWEAIRAERARRQAGRFALAPFDAPLPRWTSSELEASKMAVYAAMVERMDRQIGRVLDVLPPNSVVVFLSDNGASPEEYERWVTPDILPGPKESFHSCGPAWATASNAPLRGHKRSTYEGGISTSFIVAGPGVRSGAWSSEAGHVMDVLPTFAELAGAAAPEVEGLSLLPAFRGERLPERTLFWEHEGNRGVRRGRWKLVRGHKTAGSLYDLEKDRGERRDVAVEHPERAKELAEAWEVWAKRCQVRPFEELSAPRK